MARTKEQILQALQTAKQYMLTRKYGKDVRSSLGEVAQACYDAIDQQVAVVTTDLTDTDPNAAAQASTVGNALYGGSDQTGKTPRVISFWEHPNEVFSIANDMPPNTSTLSYARLISEYADDGMLPDIDIAEDDRLIITKRGVSRSNQIYEYSLRTYKLGDERSFVTTAYYDSNTESVVLGTWKELTLPNELRSLVFWNYPKDSEGNALNFSLLGMPANVETFVVAQYFTDKPDQVPDDAVIKIEKIGMNYGGNVSMVYVTERDTGIRYSKRYTTSDGALVSQTAWVPENLTKRTVTGDFVTIPLTPTTRICDVQTEGPGTDLRFSGENLLIGRPVKITVKGEGSIIIGTATSAYADMTGNNGYTHNGVNLKYDTNLKKLTVSGSINNGKQISIVFFDSSDIENSAPMPFYNRWYNFTAGRDGDAYYEEDSEFHPCVNNYKIPGEIYYKDDGTTTTFNPESWHAANVHRPERKYGYSVCAQERWTSDGTLARSFDAHESGAAFYQRDGYRYSARIVLFPGFTFDNVTFYPSCTMGETVKTEIDPSYRTSYTTDNLPNWTAFTNTHLSNFGSCLHAYIRNSNKVGCGRVTITYADTPEVIAETIAREDAEKEAEARESVRALSEYGGENDPAKMRFERVRYTGYGYSPLTNYCEQIRTPSSEDAVTYDVVKGDMNRGVKIVSTGTEESLSVTFRNDRSIGHYLKFKLWLDGVEKLDYIKVQLTDISNKTATFDIVNTGSYAKPWRDAELYAYGAIVVYNNILWRCISATGSNAGTGNPFPYSAWEPYDKKSGGGTPRYYFDDGLNYVVENLYFADEMARAEVTINGEKEIRYEFANGFDRSHVKKLKLMVKSKSDETVSAVFGEVATYNFRGMFAMKCDDGNWSDYEVVYPTFKANGLVANFAIARDTVKIADYHKKIGAVGTLGDPYNGELVYNTGDKATYGQYDLEYVCNQDGTTGEWDPTKWTRTPNARRGVWWTNRDQLKEMIADGFQMVNHQITQNRKLNGTFKEHNWPKDEGIMVVRQNRDFLYDLGAGRGANVMIFCMGANGTRDNIDGFHPSRRDLSEAIKKNNVRINPAGGGTFTTLPIMDPVRDFRSKTYRNHTFADTATERMEYRAMLHAAAEFGLMFSLTCHDVREIPEFVPDPSHPESTQTKFKDTTTAQKNFIEFLAEQAAALATDDNVDENGFARLEVVTYTGAFDLM